MGKINLNQLWCYDKITNQKVRLMKEGYQGFYVLIGSDWVYRNEYQISSLV